MNILHYTIGLPPRRHGGSVQYSHDLMKEQIRQGHKVYALTCGDTLFRSSKVRIKKGDVMDGIQTNLLTDPLTPTLIYGTRHPKQQFRNVEIDEENIKRFIKKNHIEVMHLHTLMGIHKDVVALIKSLGVRIIYTTHDFHGACPKYNLIDYKGELCSEAIASKCTMCNINQPSDMFLRVANSQLYQNIKNSAFFPKKKIKTKSSVSPSRGSVQEIKVSKDIVSAFGRLLDYYRDYFALVDKFHFNSSQTKDVIRQFIPFAKGEVIPVITSGIKDKRRKIERGEILRFGFVGNTNEYKGFPLLKSVLKELKAEGIDNFKLEVYGSGLAGSDPDCDSIEYRPPYKYSEISDVLYHLDGTVVPSKWYETFSLVTLESLAHGRPVIVSDHVGAKDIVAEYTPEMIFSSKDGLKELLRSILNKPEMLDEINDRILSKPWRYDVEAHIKEIVEFYDS